MRDPQTITIDGATGKPDKPQRRIDLSNLRDVRLELAYLYRKMDSGEIKTQDGTRRAFVLKTLHDVIVSAELERKLEALENGTTIRPESASGLPLRQCFGERRAAAVANCGTALPARDLHPIWWTLC